MRPEKNDYAPYYETYISKVTGNDNKKLLSDQMNESVEFFKMLNDEDASKPYAKGKWTYKETLGHMIDTERIMCYRALCFARGETKPLPGFEQDDYVTNGDFNGKDWSLLIDEYKAVRTSSILFFKSLSEQDFHKRGIANNNHITVLALLYIITGHDKHHLEVLRGYYFRNL